MVSLKAEFSAEQSINNINHELLYSISLLVSYTPQLRYISVDTSVLTESQPIDDAVSRSIWLLDIVLILVLISLEDNVLVS